MLLLQRLVIDLAAIAKLATSSKKLFESLQPGNAALFLLIRKFTGDKVLEALKGTGGTILRTSLDDSKEKALRDAISAQA